MLAKRREKGKRDRGRGTKGSIEREIETERDAEQKRKKCRIIWKENL